MTKYIHTTVEDDLHRIALLKGISWTLALNAGIKLLVNTPVEKEALIKKIGDTKSELVFLENKLGNLEQEEQEKALKKEKEEEERLKKCICCGNMLGEKVKKHKFAKGFVCNGCFMTAESTQIKEWNKAK